MILAASKEGLFISAILTISFFVFICFLISVILLTQLYMIILAFYCYIIAVNLQLKIYDIHLLSNRFIGQKFRGALLDSLLRVFTRLKSGVSQSELLAGISGEESTSRPISVVGRVQFLGIVGLSLLFPFLADSWRSLSASRGCLHSLPCPSSSQPWHVKSFSLFEGAAGENPSETSWRKLFFFFFAFKGLM